jgi:hypothetical protein
MTFSCKVRRMIGRLQTLARWKFSFVGSLFHPQEGGARYELVGEVGI